MVNINMPVIVITIIICSWIATIIFTIIRKANKKIVTEFNNQYKIKYNSEKFISVMISTIKNMSSFFIENDNNKNHQIFETYLYYLESLYRKRIYSLEDIKQSDLKAELAAKLLDFDKNIGPLLSARKVRLYSRTQNFSVYRKIVLELTY